MLTNLHWHSLLADLAVSELRLCWFWKPWGGQESPWEEWSVSCLAPGAWAGAGLSVWRRVSALCCRLWMYSSCWQSCGSCSLRHGLELHRLGTAQLSSSLKRLPQKPLGKHHVSARHPSHHLKVLFFLHPLCSAESYWHLGCLSYDHRVRWNKCYPSAPFHVVVFVCSVVWLWVWWEWWASHSGKRNVRHCVCRTRSEQSSQNCN